MVLVCLSARAAILLLHHLAFVGKGLETDTGNITSNIT